MMISSVSFAHECNWYLDIINIRESKQNLSEKIDDLRTFMAIINTDPSPHEYGWSCLSGRCLEISHAIHNQLLKYESNGFHFKRITFEGIPSYAPASSNESGHAFNIAINGADVIIIDATWKQFLDAADAFDFYDDIFIGTRQDMIDRLNLFHGLIKPRSEITAEINVEKFVDGTWPLTKPARGKYNVHDGYLAASF